MRDEMSIVNDQAAICAKSLKMIREGKSKSRERLREGKPRLKDYVY